MFGVTFPVQYPHGNKYEPVFPDIHSDSKYPPAFVCQYTAMAGKWYMTDPRLLTVQASFVSCQVNRCRHGDAQFQQSFKTLRCGLARAHCWKAQAQLDPFRRGDVDVLVGSGP